MPEAPCRLCAPLAACPARAPRATCPADRSICQAAQASEHLRDVTCPFLTCKASWLLPLINTNTEHVMVRPFGPPALASLRLPSTPARASSPFFPAVSGVGAKPPRLRPISERASPLEASMEMEWHRTSGSEPTYHTTMGPN